MVGWHLLYGQDREGMRDAKIRWVEVIFIVYETCVYRIRSFMESYIIKY